MWLDRCVMGWNNPRMNRNATMLLDSLIAQRNIAQGDGGIAHALTLAIDTVAAALPNIELEALTGQPEPPDVECDCGASEGWFGPEHDADCAAFR